MLPQDHLLKKNLWYNESGGNLLPLVIRNVSMLRSEERDILNPRIRYRIFLNARVYMYRKTIQRRIKIYNNSCGTNPYQKWNVCAVVVCCCFFFFFFLAKQQYQRDLSPQSDRDVPANPYVQHQHSRDRSPALQASRYQQFVPSDQVGPGGQVGQVADPYVVHYGDANAFSGIRDQQQMPISDTDVRMMQQQHSVKKKRLLLRRKLSTKKKNQKCMVKKYEKS